MTKKSSIKILKIKNLKIEKIKNNFSEKVKKIIFIFFTNFIFRIG